MGSVGKFTGFTAVNEEFFNWLFLYYVFNALGLWIYAVCTGFYQLFYWGLKEIHGDLTSFTGIYVRTHTGSAPLYWDL